MNQQQQQALLTIALMAAFADGANHEAEREQIRRLTELLGSTPEAADLPAIYHQVLLKRVHLAEVAAPLGSSAYRQFAYETAVCVCDADGKTTDAERQFLSELAQVLGLEKARSEPLLRQVEAVAECPVPPQVAAAQPVNALAALGAARPSEAEIDRSVLTAAIVNGALELLPQSWASVAILPLQMRMVYNIGKQYGYELDQGHIRELLATLGVGMTSQYLEQFGRKLLGGLFGQVAGGFGKQFGKSATSVAFSFATTWALGQLAMRYYAGGRQMNASVMRESFQKLLGPGRDLQARYLPEISQQAERLNAAEIVKLVRGG